MREFADLIYHVGAFGPTPFSADSQEFSMESSREMTTDDMAQLYPGLFVEN